MFPRTITIIMKLIDIYNEYKDNYKDYVLIIESGIFYSVFNKDTSIIYSLLNYKIKKSSNNYIVGFPTSNLEIVLNNLNNNNISYLVINKDLDNNYFIKDKYISLNNKHNDYIIDINRLRYLNNRIDNIYKELNKKVFDSNIEKLLFEIENLL